MRMSDWSSDVCSSDLQQAAATALAVHAVAVGREPVVESLGQEVAGVDDVGRLATDDRGADEAFALRRQLDVHALLDDVDDLLDHKAHSAVPVGEHQNRLTAFGLQDRKSTRLKSSP